MSVTVSQAFAAYAADSTIASQAIEDTFANIIANIENIKVLKGADNISSLKISGLTNTATLAQINAIRAVVPTLGLAVTGTPKLTITDSAANILNAANSSALGLATTVTLTGVNAGLSVSQANTLASKPNFSVGAGASLSISDTATNILTNSDGVKKGTAFTLTGPANTVVVADALKLAAKPGFTVPSGASLEVTGSASEILLATNAVGVAKATKVTLTGVNNALNVSNAALLVAKTGFNLAGGGTPATLVVTDTAANLLASTASTVLSTATSITVSGTANTITAAQAANFADAKVTVDTAGGATLVVTDTAANILGGNAAGIGKATALSVTGTVTAAQAKAIVATGISLLTGTTLTIADTAANIVGANPDNSTGVAKAGSFIISGVTTVDQAVSLAALTNFVLKSGTTLTITDTATNLADPANAAGVGKANTFSITSAATAEEATKLVGKPNYSLASGTSLTIVDTVDHILNPTYATGILKASSVKLDYDPTDPTANAATAVQATKLAGLKNFVANATNPLVVVDAPAAILLAANAAGVAKATSIKVTDTAGGDAIKAADFASLSAKANLTRDTGANLEVIDTAANLLSTNNVASLTKNGSLATKVTLIDPLTGANTVTAAQSATLKSMPGFDVATAGLIVADTSTNLLANANANGVALATAIKLIGAANVVDAATAKTLKADTRLTLDATAALTILDTKANLLDPAADVSLGTAIKLSGANTATVAEAVLLKALPGFALNSGATLIVADTAANLLTGNAIELGGIAAATTVKLINPVAGANTVSALEATKLAAKTGFTLGTASLVVSDTAANLILATNATGVAKATSFVLTGDTNTATAAQATAWKTRGLTFADTTATHLSRLEVADTAANILLAANSAGVGAATMVTLTGIANTVSAADAATLVAKTGFNVPSTAKLTVTGDKAALLALSSGVKGAATTIQLTGDNAATAADATLLAGLGTNKFALAAGATLVVTGDKTALLDTPANAPGLAKATTIKLSGANTATAAEATLLAGKPNYAREAGATLVITDTADNILSAANAKGVGIGTAFTLKDSSLINAANAKLLIAKPGFTIGATASVYVSDTATNLLSLATLTPDILHDPKTIVQMLGTGNTVTAADATLLAGSTGFSFAPGATLTIEDTAANLMAGGNSAGVAKATTVKVMGNSAAISASQAKTLAALPNFALNAGATLPVTDSSANLLDPVNKPGVDKATAIKLSGTTNSVTLAELNTLLAKPDFAFEIPGTTKLTIADTAANLLTLSGTTTAKNIPTAWSLTGTDNKLSAADANTLRQKTGFALANNATLEVVDIASNLLTVNYGPATKVTLSGTANAVTVAEAKTLAAMTGFTRPAGATLTVSGNSTDLLDATNAAGVALATAVKLTGTSNTVDKVKATALALFNYSVNLGATLTFADTSANILSLINGSVIDPILAKASTVTVTGSSNIVTADEAKKLAALPNMTVQTSLELADTAAKILDQTTYGTGIAKATKFTLTGALNTVNAIQGGNLVTKTGFNKGAGATLTFEDTSDNLLLNANSAVLTAADTVKLLGTSNTVTVAQADTLAGKSLTKTGSATLTVVGSKTDLLGGSTGMALADAVKLSGSNTSNAADATALAALAGGHFTLAIPGTTTLVVTDSATNLLSAGNIPGLAKATTVKLSGANAGSADDAKKLAALNGFALEADATLVITDTATNLLATANATGVGKATTVKLSGTSNTVSASDATSMVMKPNFALDTGATLVVQDTAANILGAGPGVSKASSFTISEAATVALATSLTTISNWAKTSGTNLIIADTGANLVAGAASAGMTAANKFQVTGEALAADATTLAPNPKRDGTAAFVVADTAANLLLAGNAAGLTAATAVKLTGTSNSVTAAQATTLAGANAFSVKPGATLVVKDTAAAILAASAGGKAIATSFDVSTDPGNANAATTVTASQAKSLASLSNFVLTSGTSMTVEDTATNLLDSTNAPGVAKATKFKITGTTTALQAKQLQALSNFSLAAGATLDIADTSANILLGTNSAALTAANSVTLTGTSNTVTAAEALALKGKPSFALDTGSGTGHNSATAATLVIADTATNILTAGNSTGVALATAFDVSQATVTASQAKDLKALTNFALKASTAMTVEDSGANILLAANATGVALATKFKITGSVTAADATLLKALSNYALASGTTLDVADTAAAILLVGNATGITAASTVTLTGTSNSVNVANATRLQATHSFTRKTDATLVIADTAANILATPGAVVSATSFDVSADTTITATDAKNLKALTNFARNGGTTMLVSDTAANLLMSTNSAGLAVATTVNLTGTSNTVTAAQAATLKQKANFALAAGATLLVSDTAANILTAGNLAGIKMATKFQVKGTASVTEANQLAALSGLGTANGSFTATPTNGLVIEGTASDILLAANSTGQALAAAFKVTGTTTAAQATSLAALSNFAIASSTTLAITDSATNILAAANSTGVAKADSFSVTGTVDATTATTLAALMNFRVTPTTGTLVVVDTAEHILDVNAYGSGVSLATTVKLTGANEVTAAQATTLKAKPNFDVNSASFVVTGSTSDLAANAAAVALATTVKLTGANAVDAAAAKALAAKPNFALAGGATLVVTDTAANLLSTTTSVINGVTVSNATGVALATTVHLTGTANTVSAAEAQSLKNKLNFAKDANQTLVVIDSAANLLDSTYATGVLEATTVKLKAGVTNEVNATQAKLLGAKTGFALENNTATLVVTDTAANLLDTNNAYGISKATTVKLAAGSNSVNAADATTLAGKSLVKPAGAFLTVVDTADNLLLPANMTGVGIASSVKLSGTSNRVTAAQATTLAGLANAAFTLETPGTTTLVVADSAANLLLGDNSAGVDVARSHVTSKKVIGSNTVSVAQANALVTLGAVVDTETGASLIVSDSYANIFTANAFAAGVALATEVQLTGANAASASAAKALAARAGGAVSRAANATLVITDSATNLLDTTTSLVNGVTVSNASGVALASSIKLSGTSNTVTVANAGALKALAGGNFSLNADATLVAEDTAANLLATPANLTIATKIKLQANATATAAQATLLKANAKLDATTFVIADTAANLLLPANSVGVAAATAVKLTSTNTGLTAAQAQSLAKLPGFSLDDGSNTGTNTLVAATLVVCDSAANLLLATNANGLASASTVKMTGTTNSVTAAQAKTLYDLKTGNISKFQVDIANGATMVVADSASNLLTAGADAMSNATGVKISGIANTVTRAQAEILAAMPGIGLVAGATLTISDDAAALLGASSSAMALATAVTLKNPVNGTNTISASDAATLAAKPSFTLTTGASLIVSDNTTNLLASANTVGVGKATAVTVTGNANIVSASQAALLAARPGLTITGTMTVADTATNLLLATNASGVAKATGVKLTGTANSVSAAVASTLAGLAGGNFSRDTDATLVVVDTSANLLSATNATGVTNATTVQLTGTANTVTAAQVHTLASYSGFGRAQGATLVVADTAANLLKAEYVTDMQKATTVQLAGVNSNVSVADAVKLGAMTNFTLGSASILSVSGSLADIMNSSPNTNNLAALETMAAGGKISSIVLTDSALTLTDKDYFASTALRGKITSGSKTNLALTLSITATSTDVNNATDALLTNVTSVSAAQATSAVTIDLSKQADLQGFNLIGGAGADVIKGGSTADTLKGGAGADLLTGGVTGDNTFDYTTLTDSLISGFDTITDFKSTDKIRVGSAITSVYAPTSKASTGNLSYDISSTLTAANFVKNSAAFITLTGATGGQYLVLNDGTDGFNSATDAVVKIVGATVGVGNMSLALTSGAAAETLTGSAGNDTFIGFLGADTIDGSGGTDTIVLTATSSALNSATDDQIVRVEAIDASSATAGVEINLVNQTTATEGFTITGGGGSDTITGGSGNDVIFAGSGDDTIKSFVGADTINGGAGNDTLVVTTASATSIVISNDAQLSNVEAVSASGLATAVTITLTGQKEAFSITGGNLADNLTGGSGNDTFNGFLGADTIDGGAGTDTIVLTATSATLNSALDTQIVNVEAVSAAAMTTAVKIDLTTQTTTSEGFSITGGSAADTLTGGSGDDTFIGFTAGDTVTGGVGTDTIVLTQTSSALNNALNTQIVTVEAINASAAAAGVEINLVSQTTASEGFSITGGAYADSITGASGADSISGGDGADTITGFIGADTIDGGAGADTLVLAATSSTLNSATNEQIANVEAITIATASGAAVVLALQSEGFSITGGDGADTITGGLGADTIRVGAGNDKIINFLGADTIDGGAGTDTLELTSASLTISNPTDAQLKNVEAIAAASGLTDALTINLSVQTEGFSITGGGGNDVITGGSAADSISGAAGNDTINGFVGADTVDGGAGTDTIILTATSSTLNSATNAQIANVEAINASSATAGVEINLVSQTTALEGFSITGGVGADTITGGSAADNIIGGAGNDTINGFVGADTVDGGAGADTLVLTATSATLNTAGADNARIAGIEAITFANAAAGVEIVLSAQTEGFSITGGVGADSITGGAGADNISSGAGDDTIKNFDGADTIDGGAGTDTLSLTVSPTTLAAATDSQLGNLEAISAATMTTAVNITLTNQKEGFTITGGSAGDTLTGGFGNDTFVGFVGADTITGGTGTDTITLTATSTDLNDAAATDTRIATVEAINASTAAAGVLITMTNQSEGFSITGGVGNDSITGAKGADNIIGGAGNDTITGFVGADTVNGGDGTDTITLTATSADLNTAGATDARLAGVEVISAAGANTTAVAITLTGQTEGFTITSAGGADSITGGLGADNISGGAGNDMIYGFAGADTVDGGGNNDTLVMTTTSTTLNSATDGQLVGVETVSAATAAAGVAITLSAQAEAFTITGGSGADSITGGSAADTITTGSGNDMIYGFVGADTIDGGLGVDTIVLTDTSTALNNAENAHIVNVEAVSAAANTTGVLLTLAKQTTAAEGFSITGGSGADTITGGSGADNIFTGAGDDTINGFLGADTVTGGDGVDTIVLTATSADLNIAAASDTRIVTVEAITAANAAAGVIITLTNQTEGFSITGGASADSITGGAGADNITAGVGNDMIYGFAGADTVTGGDGTDTIVLTGTSSNLNNAGDTQLVTVEAISAATATSTVTISVTNQTEAFAITGGALADTLTGGVGADTIKGGGGADSLTGGLTGANTFDYTTLKDSLISAFDTITDFKSTDKITFATTGSVGAFNTATRAATGNLATDISGALTSANFVSNGATLVTLTGNGGGQYLVMNDATAGFSATTDAVVKIVGTAPVAANFNVAITGTASADTLKGGAGADTLTGLAGVNTYDYTTFTDSLVSGFDTIADFKSTDKIKLANAVAAGDFKTVAQAGSGTLSNDITAALATASNFVASAATLVTITGTGAGQYLVLNDATAAFSSSTDAVVKIVGAAVTASNLTT